ncbi:MAG: hypothetical protein ACXWWD_06770, partial [Chitinophagaceae bacterium]
WTAAQVSDHILKSVSGILELLYTNTKQTTRKPNEKAAAARSIFLEFTTKMKSPDFILPGSQPIEKDKIMPAPENTMTKIIEAMNKLDVSAKCTAFELPGSGEFTRTEWLWFAIYHTQRHTHQLKTIYKTVVNKKPAG